MCQPWSPKDANHTKTRTVLTITAHCFNGYFSLTKCTQTTYSYTDMHTSYTECQGTDCPTYGMVKFLKIRLKSCYERSRNCVCVCVCVCMVYRESSIGIATHYGLKGPGSNAGGGQNIRTRPNRPWVSPSLLYNRYRVVPGGKAAGPWP
jgi:hypothetical protein